MAKHSSQGHKQHFLDPFWNSPLEQRCFQHCFTALHGNGHREGVIEHHSYINWTSEAGKAPHHLYFCFKTTCRHPAPAKILKTHRRSHQYSAENAYLEMLLNTCKLLQNWFLSFPINTQDSTLCLGKHPGIRINNTAKSEWNSKVYSH